MRYWYDTEFYESGNGYPISWISIGIVAEDGRNLYLENAGFDWSVVPVNHFIVHHVKPHLWDLSLTSVHTPTAADKLRRFITKDGTEFNNELWAYYGAYDHVVLAQLFGRMVDMPDGVPWFTRDVKQELERLRTFDKSIELPKQSSKEHHALNDAYWTKTAWEFLRDTEYKSWGVM